MPRDLLAPKHPPRDLLEGIETPSISVESAYGAAGGKLLSPAVRGAVETYSGIRKGVGDFTSSIIPEPENQSIAEASALQAGFGTPKRNEVARALGETATDELATFGIAKGASLGAKTFNTLRKVPRFFGDMRTGIRNVTKGELPYVESLATEYGKSVKGLGKTFQGQLDDLMVKNPNSTGSAGEALANLREQVALNPSMRAMVNAKDTPITYRILKNPDLAESLNVNEMQNLINELSSQTTQRKLQGLGIRPSDSPFLGVINDFRDAQLSAFPEMAPIRAEYRTGKKAAENLRSYFQEKALPRTIRGKMDENVVLMRDAERLLPEDVFRELRNTQKASKMKELGRDVGKASIKAAPYGALGYILAKLAGRVND